MGNKFLWTSISLSLAPQLIQNSPLIKETLSNVKRDGEIYTHTLPVSQISN